MDAERSKSVSKDVRRDQSFRSLVRTPNGRSALAEFDKLGQQNSFVSIVNYNRLMSTLRDSGELEAALELFDQMQQKKIRPTEATYTIVLNICGMLGDLNRVERYYEQLKSTPGLELNHYIYSSMIDACVKCGSFERANKILEEMRKQGLKPTVGIYTSMINGCALMTEKDTSVADLCTSLLLTMRSLNISLNRVTYATAMKVYCMCQRRHMALDLLQEMQNQNISRDIVIYSTLLKGFSTKPADPHTCLQLFQQMKKDRIYPNSYIFGLILRACCMERDSETAMRLLDEMTKLGLKPNGVIYNSVLHAHMRSRSPEENAIDLANCEALLERMQSEGVAPTSYTFNTMIKLCAKANELQKGLDYFEEMKQQNIPSTVVTYTTLIGLYTQLGNPEDPKKYLEPCFAILEEMEEKSVRLDQRVFVALLAACRRARDAKTASEVIAKMKAHRIRPNRYITTALIDVLSEVGDIEQAFEVFNGMDAEKNLPDVVTFTCMLGAFLRKNDIASVIGILKKMKAMNVRPNEVTRKFLRRVDMESLTEADREAITNLINF